VTQWVREVIMMTMAIVMLMVMAMIKTTIFLINVNFLQESDRSLAKATHQIKELKIQLESKTQEYEAMMGEVENISKAYEDVQTQNKRLLHELGQKEDVTIQVVSEGYRVKRQLATAGVEVRDMQERYARAEERCRGQLTTIEELEQQVAQAQAKFNKLFDELQGTHQTMDALRREGRDTQMQAAEFKQQADLLEKTAAESRRKIEDLVAEAEREREKVHRLEEEKNSLKRKLDRLPRQGSSSSSSSSSSGFNLAEEELRSIKQRVRCSICNDRMKDTVIGKCFHVFCHECVMTNLQTRKRRCPQCQTPFSVNDVHNMYGFV